MNPKRRRVLHQGLLGATALASLSPAYHDILAEVQRVLRKSSSPLEERAVRYFEQKIRYYWQDRWMAALSHSDLVPHLIEYVENITTLLDRSLLPSIRTRLCASLSQAMLLMGACFYDMGQFMLYVTTILFLPLSCKSVPDLALGYLPS